jgi:hypothetical protein
MVERRRSPRLAAETSLELAVLGQFFGQELERHAAAELGVLGLVHHAPAPAAQLLQDAVVGNAVANHETIASQQHAGELPSASAYAACIGESTQ